MSQNELMDEYKNIASLIRNKDLSEETKIDLVKKKIRIFKELINFRTIAKVVYDPEKETVRIPESISTSNKTEIKD